MLKLFYSDTYPLPLPEGHRFPGEKYRLVRQSLAESVAGSSILFEQSPVAARDLLLEAHQADYVDRFLNGQLSVQEVRQCGFPWSVELTQRVCATVGGALASALTALDQGVSGQLAGGTHHAGFARASGYCVFNDFAVVCKHLTRTQGPQFRIAILDLDVHQGDGNSEILKSSSQVFIASVHCQQNFPYRKIESHLDIGLAKGAGDLEYLSACEQALMACMRFEPHLLLYQAGVDPLEQDSLGLLNVSLQGLQDRDEMVFSLCRMLNVPVSIAMGGGYAKPLELTVEASANVFRAAAETFLKSSARN